MKLGFLGLGKMGMRMAKKLVMQGHDLVLWNRTIETAHTLGEELNTQNLKVTVGTTIEEVAKNLDTPKIFWLMLPAGDATQTILDEISRYISPGDIIIDGGNAHFSDTQKRFDSFSQKGIKFLGIGVSGGLLAYDNGYPLMAGGDKSAYEQIKPILDSLAKPNGGHEYFGTGGAGHFVKMVHNGIEYGQMQAISEGFTVLEKSDYKMDLVKIAGLWQKGTIVSSFLIDRAHEQLEKDQTLSSFSGPVSESGEAKWTIEQAEKEGVQVPNIKQALDYRLATQKDPNLASSFTAKMLNALRSAFGGHEIKK